MKRTPTRSTRAARSESLPPSPRAILARRDRPLRAQSARQARRALLQQELQAPQRPEQSAWRPAQADLAPAQEQPRERQARSRGCVGRGRSVGLPRGPEPDGSAQRAQARQREQPSLRALPRSGDPPSVWVELLAARSPSAPSQAQPSADAQAAGCGAFRPLHPPAPPRTLPAQAMAQRPGRAATEPSSKAICSDPSAHPNSTQTCCRTGRRATAAHSVPAPALPAESDRESSLRARPLVRLR